MSIPDAVVAVVRERAGGYCEACGWHLGSDGGVLHHRRLRSQGGPHTVANLLEIHWVCHNGHTRSIHSRIERSVRLGHICEAGDDPETKPVIVLPNLMAVRW